MIVRALVTAAIIYWIMAEDESVESRKMLLIQQAIKFHRKRATFHGRKVIDLEMKYTNLVEQGRMI